MAKRRYEFDEEKLKRWRAEGRGQGVGREYLPWLTIHDVPSEGRAARVKGWKADRLHHLLSNIEVGLFYLFDWDDRTLDIREQFPLEREVTRAIAVELGVAHPADVRSGVDIVMTTDFLIDVRTPDGPGLLARAVKPSAKLADARTLEKLEIERRYWQRRGVAWALTTEQEVDQTRVENIRWLHEMRDLGGMDAHHPDYWEDRCARVLKSLEHGAEMTVVRFLRWLEETHGFASGEGLTALRHLAANKRLNFDLDTPFDRDALLGKSFREARPAVLRRSA